MSAVVTPLKREIVGVQQGQAKLDQNFGLLERAVTAVRDGGRTNADKITQLTAAVEKLTEAFKEMKAGTSSSSAQASGSADPPRASAALASSHPPPGLGAPEYHVGTPRERNTKATEPEHLRTKLIKFPYKVHAEHVKTQ